MRRSGQVIVVVLLSVVLAGVGCDRHIPSRDPVRSAPVAPPIPINLTAQVNDRAITLTWELSDSSTVIGFNIYRSDGEDTDYYLFDSTTAFSATLGGLAFGQALRFRVTAIATTGIEGRPSDEIITVAGLLSIVLDGGDEYTRDRNVQVRLNAPGAAAYVELSEDSLFTDALVQPYGTSMSFEVSQGDGLKTVYARITFGDGSVAGEIISDDIELDTQALIDSVFFAPVGQTLSAGDTVSFFLAAAGEIGGTASVLFPGVPNVRLYDDGASVDVAIDDGIYSTRYIIPVALTVADGEVMGSFRDAAGNSATDAQAADLLNIETTTPPAAVTLAVGLVDSATAHLTWTESEDDDFASYRVYRSVSPGINVADDFLMITIITRRNTLSHDDYLSGTGTYYYRIFVYDTQGLTSASNEVVVTR